MLFKNKVNRIYLSLTYLMIFLVLEILVVTKNSFLLDFDVKIQNIISPMVTASRTSFFSIFTYLGSPATTIVVITLISIVLYFKGRKVDGIWCMTTLFIGDGIAFIIKELVRRPRPTDKVVPDAGFSFPSGHVFGTTLLILIVIYLLLPYIKNQETQFVLTIILIIWLMLVMFSRLYLRGHFASDILGSVLLASAWWEGSQMLYVRYFSTVKKFVTQRDFEKEKD